MRYINFVVVDDSDIEIYAYVDNAVSDCARKNLSNVFNATNTFNATVNANATMNINSTCNVAGRLQSSGGINYTYGAIPSLSLNSLGGMTVQSTDWLLGYSVDTGFAASTTFTLAQTASGSPLVATAVPMGVYLIAYCATFKVTSGTGNQFTTVFVTDGTNTLCSNSTPCISIASQEVELSGCWPIVNSSSNIISVKLTTTLAGTYIVSGQAFKLVRIA